MPGQEDTCPPLGEGVSIKKAACFFCYQNCGMLVKVKNGTVIDVVGDYGHPKNKGAMCPRALSWKQWIDHPDRLNYPLRRVGRQGEGKWERISWDNAFDNIAERLNDIRSKYGAEAVAATSGTNRTDDWARRRFFNLFGTPNLFKAAHICWCPDFMIESAIYGYAAEADISESRCIILWGHNAAVSYLPEMRHILDMKEATGAEIIVVDPKFTETVAKADVWLQLRPATDAALALGFLNFIIEQGFHDKAFLLSYSNAPFLVRLDKNRLLRESDVSAKGDQSRFVIWDAKENAVRPPKHPEKKASLTGIHNLKLADGSIVECVSVWDLLKKRVSEYSLEKVEEITWVPRDKIAEAATMYAKLKPSAIQWGVALDHIGLNGGAAIQARALLPLITGNLDVPGGNMLSGPHPTIINDAELEMNESLGPEQRRKQLGADSFLLMKWTGYQLICDQVQRMWKKPVPAEWMCQAHPPTVWRAILNGEPYPIKALIVTSDNPLVAFANTNLVYQALTNGNLELLVVMDFWMTPTAALADYVLPAADWLERPVWSSTFGLSSWFIVSERSVNPHYERLTDYEFWRLLGCKIGQKDHWPWDSLEQVYGERLKPLGVSSYEDFIRDVRGDFPIPQYRKYIRNGFATTSGKAELYSSVLESLGYDPLPNYEEPAESPVRTPTLSAKFPFILVAGGNFMPFHHSEGRQIPRLRAMNPDPICDIHPDTAKQLKISDGDWVYVETVRGQIRQRARFNLGIDPRVIYVQKGWWLPEKVGDVPLLDSTLQSDANMLTSDEPSHCDPMTGSWYTRGLLCRIYKA